MTERGVIAGQVCEVEFLDKQLRPTSRAAAVLLRLTFTNGSMLMPVSEIELVTVVAEVTP